MPILSFLISHTKKTNKTQNLAALSLLLEQLCILLGLATEVVEWPINKGRAIQSESIIIPFSGKINGPNGRQTCIHAKANHN